MSRRKATGKPVGVEFLARMKRLKIERRLANEYHLQRARHAADPDTQRKVLERIAQAARADARVEKEQETGEEDQG